MTAGHPVMYGFYENKSFNTKYILYFCLPQKNLLLKMLNIVLFGPPGAGKGTQSENLINKYGLVHLSTGDLLRSEIAAGSELGKRAKEVMARGELVGDEIVIGMIETKLDDNQNAKGFIFDGFPRTAAQAVALDDLLQKKGTGISGMLALEVDDEELVNLDCQFPF